MSVGSRAGAGVGTSVKFSSKKVRDYYITPEEQKPKKCGRSSSDMQQPDTLLTEQKIL